MSEETLISVYRVIIFYARHFERTNLDRGDLSLIFLGFHFLPEVIAEYPSERLSLNIFFLFFDKPLLRFFGLSYFSGYRVPKAS